MVVVVVVAGGAVGASVWGRVTKRQQVVAYCAAARRFVILDGARSMLWVLPRYVVCRPCTRGGGDQVGVSWVRFGATVAGS